MCWAGTWSGRETRSPRVGATCLGKHPPQFLTPAPAWGWIRIFLKLEEEGAGSSPGPQLEPPSSIWQQNPEPPSKTSAGTRRHHIFARQQTNPRSLLKPETCSATSFTVPHSSPPSHTVSASWNLQGKHLGPELLCRARAGISTGWQADTEMK